MNIVASEPEPLWKTAPRRAIELVNEHRIISGLVAAGAILRALAIVAARPALLFYGDSFSYIQDARTLSLGNTRPIGYSFFMRLLGIPGGSLLRVVVVQHLLGLALGVCIYAICRKLGLAKWVAAIAAAPILLDGFQINIEHFIMAELLFDVLAFAGIALLISTTRKPSVFACGVAGALLAFSTLTRVVGIVMIAFAFGYGLMKRFGWRRLVALSLAFVIPIGLYAEWFSILRAPHRFALSSKDGSFLYGRVAPFVSCPGLKIPPYEQQLCDLRPSQARPDSNYYIWDLGAPHLTGLPIHMDDQAVLTDFAIRAMTQEPGLFAKVIFGDLFHYFSFGHWTGPKDFTINRWQFDTIRSDERRVEHAAALEGPPAVPPHINTTVANLLGRYQRTFYTWGPLQLIAILLGLAGAIGSPGALRLRAESLMFAFVALAMLLLPLITSMFDYRYSLPALPFTGPSLAIGGTVVARRIKGVIESRHANIPTSAPAPSMSASIGS
ncbi:MAG: hypothetical protein ACYDCC_02445 [Actinomycetota bacterium]